MNPLTKEEAIRFGTAYDKIDCHSASKKGRKGEIGKRTKKESSEYYFQTPNMAKYDTCDALPIVVF